MITDEMEIEERSVELLFWFRLNAVVVALLPAAMCLLERAIYNASEKMSAALIGSSPGLAVGLVSIALAFHPRFVTCDVNGLLHRGAPYLALIITNIILYGWLLVKNHRRMCYAYGVCRVEVQFLLINSWAAAFLCCALNGVGNYANIRYFNRIGISIIVVAAIAAAAALLFYRVFNAREVVLKAGRKISFTFVAVVVGFSAWYPAKLWIAAPFDLLFCVGLGAPLVFWIDARTKEWLDKRCFSHLARIRRTGGELARPDRSPGRLADEFGALLSMEFCATHARVLFNDKESHDQLYKRMTERVGFEIICDLGWLTPESLARRPPELHMFDLGFYLSEGNFALLVTLPIGSPKPTTLIGLGARRDGTPFTFPEIEKLRTLGTDLDFWIHRSQRVDAAAVRARADEVSWLSRGLIHDIRNMLTPVASYFSFFQDRMASKTQVAKAGEVARKSVKLIESSLAGAQVFAGMADAKYERVDLVELCTTAIELWSDRAGRAGIELRFEGARSSKMMLDASLIQRMLGNLLGNAIEASPAGRIIEVRVERKNAHVTELCIRDHGCGIKAADRDRIFDPDFSTKTVPNGPQRGIGLSICRRIVALHEGTIVVERPSDGGTRFRVQIPVNCDAARLKAKTEEAGGNNIEPNLGFSL